jgi:hypothetical protein
MIGAVDSVVTDILAWNCLAWNCCWLGKLWLKSDTYLILTPPSLHGGWRLQFFLLRVVAQVGF